MKSNTTLADRIVALTSELNWKPAELARQAEVSRASVSDWLSGKTKTLNPEVAQRLERKSGFNAIWLATGQGNRKALTTAEPVAPSAGDYLPIRRVKLKLSAGISGFAIEVLNGELAPIFFARKWFEAHGFKPEKLLAIQVEGRSMESTVFDGDWVVVNTADTEVRDGKVYALNYEGEPAIKCLISDGERWIATSDNPDKVRYRDRPVTENTHVIGRIVHKQSEHI